MTSACKLPCANFGTCVRGTCQCPALYDGPDCSNTAVRDSPAVQTYLVLVVMLCTALTVWSVYRMCLHLRARRWSPNTTTTIWLCLVVQWPLVALEKTIDPALAITDGHHSLIKPAIVAASRIVFLTTYCTLLATWRHVITDASHLLQSLAFGGSMSLAYVASIAAIVTSTSAAARNTASGVFVIMDMLVFLLFCTAVPIVGSAIIVSEYISPSYRQKISGMLHNYVPAMLLAVPLRILSPFIGPLAPAWVVFVMEVLGTLVFMYLDVQMLRYVSRNTDLRRFSINRPRRKSFKHVPTPEVPDFDDDLDDIWAADSALPMHTDEDDATEELAGQHHGNDANGNEDSSRSIGDDDDDGDGDGDDDAHASEMREMLPGSRAADKIKRPSELVR